MTSMAEDARPWRCFWAVSLPEDLRSSLVAFVSYLRAAPGVEDAWRFTEPEGWHITLAFLGAIPPETVEPMTMRVAAGLDGAVPSSVMVGGLGGFPAPTRARVLWYGMADAQGRLADLARRVRTALSMPADERFQPHVTLARSRQRHGTPIPKGDEEAPRALIPVREVALFRSHLGRGPARYEPLARLPIAEPAAVAAR